LGSSIPDYRTFVGTDAALRGMVSTARLAWSRDPRGIVQLGILVLIATPIVRVAFMLVAFARQRDRLYVALTAIVLALLLYGLVVAT
jgi:uncharacterized membrane protein